MLRRPRATVLLGALCLSLLVTQSGSALHDGRVARFRYRIVGGTWLDRRYGLVGTAFAIDSVDAGRLLVTVTGPRRWNHGRAFRCGGYRPRGGASTRAICWVGAPARHGLYKAQPAVGASAKPRRGSEITISRRLLPPTITTCDVTLGNVSLRWRAGRSAASFLVRVSPFPWQGRNTREHLFPGWTRSARLTGLRLVRGHRYQLTVFAFSADLEAPGETPVPFDISSDDVVKTAPRSHC
jgi:hypothetical protein